MFHDVRRRVRKAGQPPGTLIYTGDKRVPVPVITMIHYDAKAFKEKQGPEWDPQFLADTKTGITWIHVQGLQDVNSIKAIAEHYQLHALTVEDILNNEQRTKVEEFDNYIFLTMKMLLWDEKTKRFSVEGFSLVIGKNFVLSFQDCKTNLFDSVAEKLTSVTNQRIRELGSDYLAYRLMDIIVDKYFVVLESLGDQIESVEENVINAPTPHNARIIYRLKRQMLVVRKVIWPMREILSHLLQTNMFSVSSFTHIYLRDVYDHAVQAIDTLETFRDMLSGMLDIYLSSLTNRMNEIMKVLTIIATIFIPITFIASVYGMNFDYMPELHWHFGFYIVLGVMFLMAGSMLVYFRKKNWL